MKNKLKLIVICLIIVLSGCRARKTLTNTTTIIKERFKDSVYQSEISREISDSLFVKFSKIKTSNPNCDSIVNAEMVKFLEKINSNKQSGDNQLGFFYDKVRNLLVAYGYLTKTNSEKTKVSNFENTDKDKVIEVPVKEPIPFIIKVFATIGILVLIGLVIYIVLKFIR